jgi:hypothetical protein
MVLRKTNYEHENDPGYPGPLSETDHTAEALSFDAYTSYYEMMKSVATLGN